MLGKSINLTIAIKDLPASLATGSYYLIAQTVDAGSNMPYVATNSTTAVAAPFVAVTATASAVKPAKIAIGKSGSVVITLINSGNINATGTLVVTLSPSADGVSAVAGVTLATTHVRATIKPGKIGKYTVHFKIPVSLAGGSYYTYAAVSFDGVSATAIGIIPFNVG